MSHIIALKGSSKIEGIMLDPPQREEINWVDTALEKMKKLRILVVRNTRFSSPPSYPPNQLRLLDWKEYPSQSFPSGFHPKKIVALNLRGRRLVQPFQVQLLACFFLRTFLCFFFPLIHKS